MTHEELKQLTWQLARLPGGPQAAIPDFFALQLGDVPVTSGHEVETWPLRDGTRLLLAADAGGKGLRLAHAAAEEVREIATLPAELVDVAREDGVSPLVLALLAVATGQVDDGRRLKAALPRIDGAAKDLMLMTVCRLCG